MSVDFYAVLPIANWPTAVAVQKCMADHAYPLQIKRFPALDRERIVNDGILVTIDGRDAYLEGALAPSSAMKDETKDINGRLVAAGSNESITSDDAMLSFRVRSPSEMQAASYVISALIVCFDGFGFEPQGNGSGREEFAQSLLAGAAMLKDQN